MKATRSACLFAASTVFSLGMLLEADQVKAASFNFSYVFESGEVLSGMVDGELEDDGNTVSNLTNLMAEYSDLPNVTFDFLIFGNSTTATLDGSLNVFGGADKPLSLGQFFFANDTRDMSGVGIFLIGQAVEPSGGGFSVDTFESEGFDSHRWSMSLKSVPEPTFTLGLLALAAIGSGAALKRNKKHS